MKDKFQIRIFDDLTGEVVPLDKRPSDMKAYIKTLEPKDQSILLTKVNYLRKLVGAAEKTIKDYVKALDLDFDDDGVAMWQEFKLKKVSTYRFNKKKFEDEATAAEKEVIKAAEEIQEKYKSLTTSIRL